jgi:signal transduction histidine kinase
MEMAEQFNKQQLLLARAEASNIQSHIGRIKDELLDIVQLVSISRMNDIALFEYLTNEFLKDFGKVRMGVKYIDSEGVTLFSEGALTIEDTYNGKFTEMADGSCQDEGTITQDRKRIYIVISVCRFGSFAGAVVTVIDILDIGREFLSPIKSGTRGYAWMMDGKGNLLYHPTQPTMVGRNLYETDTSCFKCHKSFDVEKKIIEGKGDYYGKYVAPTGEDKVLAFSTVTVGDSKWIVTVSAPYSEVTLAIQTSMRFYSLLAFLIFLSASIVSAALIVLNRKRVKAEEGAKHQKELEQYAENLEQKVDIRTRELTSEKEKLNTIVSTIGSGIMLVDSHRKIQWVNQSMKDIVGKDITGTLCDNYFTDCEIIGSYKVNNVQTDILTNLFGKGDRYFQVTTAPLKSDEEGVYGFIRLVQDVTEMKRLEEQMMHSEKLALLERMTAGIAQEIGNPLTSVFSFVQVLKEREQDEFKKESLETIYLYMNRISDILNQLSGFSKIPPVELKPCKVNSLIEDALSLIQFDTRVNDITIVRDLMTDLPLITTDGNQLSHVIVAIVLNAADAMPDGGTLTIRSMATDRNIVIAFEDRGIGIPQENLSRIFDPFYTTKEKATGLGLSVSQSIIKKLNGSITVESELNRGATFTITLPTNEVNQI